MKRRTAVPDSPSPRRVPRAEIGPFLTRPIRIVLLGAVVCVVAVGGGRSAGAQAIDSMPGMAPPPAPKAAPTAKDGGMEGMSMDSMDMGKMDMAGMPMMAGDLGRYAMTRDASGTSWAPESTPMAGMSWSSGGWNGMVHGSVFGVYDHQGGPRGDTKAYSSSMLMVMAQHAEGVGTLTLRTMLSLDPAIGADGYPLLLQTGETADGKTPLVDRQHPHDLFMELAGVYSRPIDRAVSAFLYVGYPGEPALGPPAFMHRSSGMDDPAAPITHHWLDSTHITYGVITAGLVRGPWKLEGSVFKGREPDQHRWDFDRPGLDSWSGRLSWNPNGDWALQASYGFIKSPEQLEPAIDQRRATASATYNRPIRGGNWQTTLAWGRNAFSPGPVLNGWLLESAVSLGRHTLFARAEDAQKNELFQPPNPVAGQVFEVAAFNLGYIYDIPLAKHVALGLGALGSAYHLPSTIKPAYGGGPTSIMAFLRLKIR